MVRKILKICFFSSLLVILTVIALLAVSPFYIYSVFNQESPVARLHFSQQGEMEYLATVTTGNFCKGQTYSLSGDQFQLDAGFTKWIGAAVILGFEPRYRLDRLSGRYSDIQQQNSRQTISHDLAPDLLFDFFDEIENSGHEPWLVDTTFGSSVYRNIDPLLSYTVYATEDSLVIRTEPIVSYSESGNLVIDVSQGCAESRSGFKDLLVRVNPG